MTGRSDFCEIFFDDARVPVANRVGAENGGWAVTRTTPGHERIASAVTQTATTAGWSTSWSSCAAPAGWPPTRWCATGWPAPWSRPG